MPFIDFNEAEELPEGLTPELLESDSVQNFLKSKFDASYEAKFEVEASGLKATNLALKDEKTTLKGHLDQYKDIDLNEIERLRELAKNNGDAVEQINRLTTERDGIREAYALKLEAAEASANDYASQLNAEKLTNRVGGGIQEHNSSYESVALLPGMEHWLMEEAKSVFQQDEKGNYIPMNGDRVMTGADGNVMSIAEWVNSLRTNPRFAPFYKKPTGSGATGGNGGGTGQYFNPKNMAGTKEERTAAIAAKYNLPQ